MAYHNQEGAPLPGTIEEELIRAFGGEVKITQMQDQQEDVEADDGGNAQEIQILDTSNPALVLSALDEAITRAASSALNKGVETDEILKIRQSLYKNVGYVSNGYFYAVGYSSDPAYGTTLYDFLATKRTWSTRIRRGVVYNFSKFFSKRGDGFVFNEAKFTKTLPFAIEWILGQTGVPVLSLEDLKALDKPPKPKEDEAKVKPTYTIDTHFRLGRAFFPGSIYKSKGAPEAKPSPRLTESVRGAISTYSTFLGSLYSSLVHYKGRMVDYVNNDQHVLIRLEQLIYSMRAECARLLALGNNNQQVVEAPPNEVPIITAKIAKELNPQIVEKGVAKFLANYPSGLLVESSYFTAYPYWGTFEDCERFVEDVNKHLQPIGAQVTACRRLVLISHGAYREADFNLYRDHANKDATVYMLKDFKTPSALPFFRKLPAPKPEGFEQYMVLKDGVGKASALMYCGTPYLLDIKWNGEQIQVFADYAAAMYNSLPLLVDEKHPVNAEPRRLDGSEIMYIGNCGWCERNVQPAKNREGRDYHSPYVNQKRLLEWLTNSYAVRRALEGASGFANNVVLGASVATKASALDAYLQALSDAKKDAQGVRVYTEPMNPEAE